LAPGGVASFHFVAEPDETLRGKVFARVPNRWLNPLRRLAWRRQAVFEMHALDEARLVALLDRHPQLRLLEAFDDPSAGPGWRGRRWYVVNDDEVPVEVSARGYRMYARASDVAIGAPLIAGYGHDANVDAALRAHLKPGATFLDIGANIGVFTALGASVVGAEGRVVAVEPIARNAELIERACRSNGFEQVRVIRAAASDRAGAVGSRGPGGAPQRGEQVDGCAAGRGRRRFARRDRRDRARAGRRARRRARRSQAARPRQDRRRRHGAARAARARAYDRALPAA